MLKRYMLMCRNAKGVHGKQKIGNPWPRSFQVSKDEGLVIEPFVWKQWVPIIGRRNQLTGTAMAVAIFDSKVRFF